MSEITIEQLQVASGDAKPETLIAAIDLGSNSFHMVIAKIVHDDLQIQTRLKEKVQLIAGMQNGLLAKEAIERGLACLRRFAQCISHIPSQNVRVVATFSLRAAVNSADFCRQAMFIIRQPVQVVSGVEEARLIYSGVAHDLYEKDKKRLIVDIGGGSTEVTIGHDLNPLKLHSFNCGCVSFKDSFFKEGVICADNFEKAVTTMQLQIMPIADDFLTEGWDECYGASGTVKVVLDILQSEGKAKDYICYDSLSWLVDRLLKAGHEKQLTFEALSDARRNILAPGTAILYALFRALKISAMHFSVGALREGVLFDMLGSRQNRDIKAQSIINLGRRYHIDEAQAIRVRDTAVFIYQQIARDWVLDNAEYQQLLTWAAMAHEVGLNISYTHNHMHAAYIVEHADLPGFGKAEQKAIAVLIRGFRRKIIFPQSDSFSTHDLNVYQRLIRILRLAVLLNRERKGEAAKGFDVSVSSDYMHIDMSRSRLKENDLLNELLASETRYLSIHNMALTVQI